MTLIINAFDGTDKVNELQFTRHGVPFNFEQEQVQRIALVAVGKSVDGEADGSAVKFKTGDLGLRPGIYYPKVLIFTAEKPKGDPIAGPGEEIEIELHYHS